MNIELTTVRLLGVAQLFVFGAGVVSEQLLKSAVESDGTAGVLANISKNIPRLQVSNFLAVLNSAAIVVLGSLFYILLNDQNKGLALLALGFFLAEAITLALSKIGSYALVPLSREYIAAGAPEKPRYETLGNLFYKGVDRRGYDIHMLFFCLGGILWYYLLYLSGGLPWLISLWGLVSLCLLTIPVVLALLDREALPAMVLGLPYLPFEPVLGVWLIIEGFN